MRGKRKKDIDLDEWTNECELLLAEWSEKASCYRWLHGRSEKKYKLWYYGFSIPVIILSTLSGAANVGMDSFVPAESKSLASAIVGGVNIFAGIISTLQNFLKVAELMEGHRLAGISWGKLQRNIAIELALDRKRRVLQSDFLKLARSEYDRLIEAGPLIDDSIIKQFNKRFHNYKVSMPSICNGLDKCVIYKVTGDGNDKEDINYEYDSESDKDLDENIDSNDYKKEDYTVGVEDILDEQEKLLPNKELIIKIDKKVTEDEKNKEDKKNTDKEFCNNCDKVESLTGE
jgi:hypothetical protein